MTAACLRMRAPLVTAACAVVSFACSDSPHLYPPPDATTTTNVGGGGGGAPIACSSSSDCPAPQAICDRDRAVCVECLEVQHCAFRPGTVCSQGECVCPGEGDTFCPAISKANESRPDRCANLQTSQQDCGSCGHGCFGACAAGKCVDPWEPTPLGDAPSARMRQACAWTGKELVVWGGDTAAGVTATGGRLDPASGTWKPTSLANAPSPRSFAPAVWTGDELIVWGGWDGAAVGTGAVYDPVANTWTPLSTLGAPSKRYAHGMVWDDKELLVWGGHDGTDNLDTGARFDPKTNSWSPMSAASAPTQRRQHVAVWNGSRLVIWGGFGSDGMGDAYLDTGAQYDPTGDAWEALPGSAPSPRADAAAVATNAGVFVWGGTNGADPPLLGDGATLTTAPS